MIFSSFEDNCQWQDVLALCPPYLCRLLEEMKTMLPWVVLKTVSCLSSKGAAGIKGNEDTLPEPEEASS